MHHRIREYGKTKIKTCYLGAEKYDYVERFQNLMLSGLIDKDRFRRYMLELIDKLSIDDLKWVMEEIKRLIEERTRSDIGEA